MKIAGVFSVQGRFENKRDGYKRQRFRGFLVGFYVKVWMGFLDVYGGSWEVNIIRECPRER